MNEKQVVEEALSKLANNKSFVEAVKHVETPEDLQSVLKQYNVEMSVEEIIQMIDVMKKLKENGNESELSEDILDDVSGGVVVTGAIALGVAGKAALWLLGTVGAFLLTKAMENAWNNQPGKIRR